jgi:hypothetical protein
MEFGDLPADRRCLSMRTYDLPGIKRKGPSLCQGGEGIICLGQACDPGGSPRPESAVVRATTDLSPRTPDKARCGRAGGGSRVPVFASAWFVLLLRCRGELSIDR